uniref:short neurotoxin SNTX11-like n=1 Tax=Podarcis muralis TaxID=64176 RepID=UPI00109F7F4C|nr:short neurotoxin SNTX11-like [Podarcis muralis]
MNKVLAVGFLALVYVDMAVGSFVCHYCRKVKTDNTCVHAAKTCRAGQYKFCYTQLIAKGLSVVNVDRGCTMKCETVRYRKTGLEKYMLCCNTDRCNHHNIWVKE